MVFEINIVFHKTVVIGISGMIILTLGIENFAERSAVTDSFNLAVELHLRIIFRKHIYGIALFECSDKLNALSHRTVADTLGKYVNPLFKALYSIRCVFVEIIRKNNCIEVKFKKLIEILINGNIETEFSFAVFSSFGIIFAKRILRMWFSI